MLRFIPDCQRQCFFRLSTCLHFCQKVSTRTLMIPSLFSTVTTAVDWYVVAFTPVVSCTSKHSIKRELTYASISSGQVRMYCTGINRVVSTHSTGDQSSPRRLWDETRHESIASPVRVELVVPVENRGVAPVLLLFLAHALYL